MCKSFSGKKKFAAKISRGVCRNTLSNQWFTKVLDDSVISHGLQKFRMVQCNHITSRHRVIIQNDSSALV